MGRSATSGDAPGSVDGVRKLRIGILTETYPYGVGEQFFGPEVEHWGSAEAQVVLMPFRRADPTRPLPASVELDHGLVTGRGRGENLRSLLRATGSSVLWRELLMLRRRRILGLRTGAEAYVTVARVHGIARKLRGAVKRQGPFDVVYTYWHAAAAYAAVEVKKTGGIGAVVSRVHRVDLYEETRTSGYQPLKRHYGPLTDVIHSISEDGKTYLHKQYGIPPERLRVSRLGVAIPRESTRPSPQGDLAVLSVSYCASVKRVDRIIEGLSAVARSRPDVQLRWSHLGGGSLQPELERLAEDCFEGLPNVTWKFMGQVDHAGVLDYYGNNEVDVLVNMSSSEGIPVSIMEAMARGVPCIATDVGGTSELVGIGGGVLLPSDASSTDLAEVILKNMAIVKQAGQREQVATYVRQNFDAEHNFPEFVSQVLKVAAERSIS